MGVEPVMGKADPKTPPAATGVPTGPWPFITHRRYRVPGHPDRIWRSRDHRKTLAGNVDFRGPGLGPLLAHSLRAVHKLNWWIGILFAIGSLLFMLGSVLALYPTFATHLGFDAAETNAVFFAGSIPFSGAAFLQLFQAGRAPPPEPNPGEKKRHSVFLGWKPHDIGWLSCALQFGGTLLFNINTFDAMRPNLDRIQYDFAVWAPDALGSVLFLASGYLAFIEVGHRYWTWQPKEISWLVTFINLIGCVAFMVSAVFAFEPIRQPDFDAIGISTAFTLAGAAAFLVGSLLMLPEGADQV